MTEKILRAPKKKKAKRKKSKISTERIILSAAFVVSVMLVAILAFISVDGAVFATGFLACGSFLFYEHRRRNLWERAANFKFKALSKEQEKLTRESARNRHDIASLKEGIYDVALNIDEPDSLTVPGKENSLVERLTAMARKPRASSTPRAIKPSAAAPANIDYGDEGNFSDEVVQELMHFAIRNDRVEVFMQPIVRLPQRQTRFYEVFARIRANPGSYIPASRYINLAQQDGIIHDIDQLLLMQCLKTIQKTAHLDQAAPFFLNITSKTLASKTFMNVLLKFLAKNRDLAPRLVFEIRQQDFENMHPAILEILRGLGKLGCALSMDHIEALEFDLKMMQVLKVRFVKINAKRLLAHTKDEKMLTDIWRLKRKLEGNGIGFIAEKIENENHLRNLLDVDLHYGQGYLFGKPDLQGAYRTKKRVYRGAA